MLFAVCRLSVVAVRREPDLISEMSSQVRGGEVVGILENKDEWWRARLLIDRYEGWVNSRQFSAPVESVPPAPVVFTDELCGEAVSAESRIALPLASPLADFSNGTFSLGGRAWTWTGKTRVIPAGPPDKTDLFAYARRFLDTPYQWGGRTVFGIDCSGFVQSVMGAFGVSLLRDSKQQVSQGNAVRDFAAAVPGDLAFFGSPDTGISHVGLLLPGNEIIHASAMVRIDDLLAEGIRNRETGEMSHKLAAIRRVL